MKQDERDQKGSRNPGAAANEAADAKPPVAGKQSPKVGTRTPDEIRHELAHQALGNVNEKALESYRASEFVYGQYSRRTADRKRPTLTELHKLVELKRSGNLLEPQNKEAKPAVNQPLHQAKQQKVEQEKPVQEVNPLQFTKRLASENIDDSAWMFGAKAATSAREPEPGIEPRQDSPPQKQVQEKKFLGFPASIKQQAPNKEKKEVQEQKSDRPPALKPAPVFFDPLASTIPPVSNSSPWQTQTPSGSPSKQPQSQQKDGEEAKSDRSPPTKPAPQFFDPLASTIPPVNKSSPWQTQQSQQSPGSTWQDQQNTSPPPMIAQYTPSWVPPTSRAEQKTRKKTRGSEPAAQPKSSAKQAGKPKKSDGKRTSPQIQSAKLDDAALRANEKEDKKKGIVKEPIILPNRQTEEAKFDKKPIIVPNRENEQAKLSMEPLAAPVLESTSTSSTSSVAYPLIEEKEAAAFTLLPSNTADSAANAAHAVDLSSPNAARDIASIADSVGILATGMDASASGVPNKTVSNELEPIAAPDTNSTAAATAASTSDPPSSGALDTTTGAASLATPDKSPVIASVVASPAPETSSSTADTAPGTASTAASVAIPNTESQVANAPVLNPAMSESQVAVGVPTIPEPSTPASTTYPSSTGLPDASALTTTTELTGAPPVVARTIPDACIAQSPQTAPLTITDACIAQTTPPTILDGGIAQTAPPTITDACIAQTTPPTITDACIAQTTPPAITDACIAQTTPPTILDACIAQTTPPTITDGIAQTTPESSASAPNVEPSHIPRTVHPTYIDQIPPVTAEQILAAAEKHQKSGERPTLLDHPLKPIQSASESAPEGPKTDQSSRRARVPRTLIDMAVPSMPVLEQPHKPAQHLAAHASPASHQNQSPPEPASSLEKQTPQHQKSEDPSERQDLGEHSRKTERDPGKTELIKLPESGTVRSHRGTIEMVVQKTGRILTPEYSATGILKSVTTNDGHKFVLAADRKSWCIVDRCGDLISTEPIQSVYFDKKGNFIYITESGKRTTMYLDGSTVVE